jgi:uncharacterized protein (DUF1499 family)
VITLFLASCSAVVINDVTTGETPEYPEIVALYAQTNAGRAFDRAEAVAAAMPRWDNCVIERTDRTAVIHCEAHTRFFTDDVWIWTEAAGRGMARVMTRSASRVGKGDFGTNARRIKAFQKAYREFDLPEN